MLMWMGLLAFVERRGGHFTEINNTNYKNK